MEKDIDRETPFNIFIALIAYGLLKLFNPIRKFFWRKVDKPLDSDECDSHAELAGWMIGEVLRTIIWIFLLIIIIGIIGCIGYLFSSPSDPFEVFNTNVDR